MEIERPIRHVVEDHSEAGGRADLPHFQIRYASAGLKIPLHRKEAPVGTPAREERVVGASGREDRLDLEIRQRADGDRLGLATQRDAFELRIRLSEGLFGL
jgi:hypothetical protein